MKQYEEAVTQISKKFRAVLWDYPEGEPGGGGSDSTLSCDQLPKTDWCETLGDAQIAGERLNRESCGGDFFVRTEEETWPSA